MSPQGSLNNGIVEVTTEHDTVVIQKMIEAIPGGKTLDVSNFTNDVINAGHVIIKETANGVFKPLPISNGNYVALPANHEYVGVLYVSVLKSKPFASIMVRGTMNDEASKKLNNMPAVPDAAKTKLVLIRFTQD